MPGEAVVTVNDPNLTVAKVDSTPAVPATPADPNRPAWLPEKFKTAEDMAKSYKELETKLGTPKVEAPSAEPAKPAAGVPQVTTPDAAAKTVQDAGLDMAALSTEYNKDGALSQTTYDALAAKGIPKATVDLYIEGQKARVEQYTNTLAEGVGGRDKLNTLLLWAGTAVDAKEIESINTTLTSGNEALSKTVLAGLQARYVAAVGQDPTLVTGAEGVRGTGPQAFKSSAEVVAAMRDARYKTDPAYRAEVAKRLETSDFSSGSKAY